MGGFVVCRNYDKEFLPTYFRTFPNKFQMVFRLWEKIH